MPLAFEWWIALVFFVGTGPAIDTTSYSTAIANRSEFTIVVAPVDSKRIPAIGQIGGSQARALAPGNHASQYSIHNAPAYWSGTVYVAVSGGPLMALQLSGGLLPVNGGTAIAASQSAQTYGYTPPTPTISYSPSGHAIVWALDNQAHAMGPAILRAYDANNLGSTLYSSSQLPADTAGNAAKFTLPVVANGHVYVAGAGALTVYGLAH